MPPRSCGSGLSRRREAARPASASRQRPALIPSAARRGCPSARKGFRRRLLAPFVIPSPGFPGRGLTEQARQSSEREAVFGLAALRWCSARTPPRGGRPEIASLKLARASTDETSRLCRSSALKSWRMFDAQRNGRAVAAGLVARRVGGRGGGGRVRACWGVCRSCRRQRERPDRRSPRYPAPSLRPAASRSRWCSAPAAGCSRTPTLATARCRCIRRQTVRISGSASRPLIRPRPRAARCSMRTLEISLIPAGT
jgi:hypothetical protein